MDGGRYHQLKVRSYVESTNFHCYCCETKHEARFACEFYFTFLSINRHYLTIDV